MKEAYFTEKNLSSKSEEMIKHLHQSTTFFCDNLSPGRAALLVIDMQNVFLNPSSAAFLPSGPAIVSVVGELIRLFSRAGRPVLFTRHRNDPDDAAMMGRWWRDLILPGSRGSRLIPELDYHGATVIDKSQYDAFFGTNLAEILGRSAVSQLVICGVKTHLCYETTARAAFVRGFEVYLPLEGSATDNEAFHRASLLNLSHGFAVICRMAEVRSAFGETL